MTGLLGLPSPSTAILDGLEKPTAKHFLAPLLVVLAEKAAYQPLRYIRMTKPRPGIRCVVRDEVLRISGYDPKDEDSLPFPLWGQANPAGMYRRVWYAMRDNSRDFLAKRPRKRALPLFLVRKSRKWDEWALTEAGVAVAASLRDVFLQDGKNVTSVWLDGQFATGLYERIFATLSGDPSLAREAEFGEIADHIHNYVAAVIRRDSFKSRIARGDPPRYAQLCEWIRRRAISSFRKASQDALLRESRGARTRQERVNGAVNSFAVVASPYREIEVQDERHPEDGVRVIVDPFAHEAALHTISWERGMERVREAVTRQRRRAGDRYARVLDEIVEGASVKDIAEKEGVSANRAGNLRASTRDAIRDALQMAEDARAILSYVQEEPFATRGDIEEDVPVESNLTQLLQILVERNRLVEDNGSYRIGPQGPALLNDYALVDQNSIEGLAVRVAL